MLAEIRNGAQQKIGGLSPNGPNIESFYRRNRWGGSCRQEHDGVDPSGAPSPPRWRAALRRCAYDRQLLIPQCSPRRAGNPQSQRFSGELRPAQADRHLDGHPGPENPKLRPQSTPIFRTTSFRRSSTLFRRPDILIVEGLNVLQGASWGDSGSDVVPSDFLDVSIYIDAVETDVADWFRERLLDFRSAAERAGVLLRPFQLPIGRRVRTP